MDAFGDNFVKNDDVDPAAEFLAREQDELAGLEVEIPSVGLTNGIGRFHCSCVIFHVF